MANATELTQIFTYICARKNDIKLGRGRDKSHQFSTDRYTGRAFIKI